MKPLILNADRIPPSPCIVIPSSLDYQQLVLLESQFQSKDITYLVEKNATFSNETHTHFDQSETNGISFELHENSDELGAALRRQLGPEGVLIFLPGTTRSRPATSCQIPVEQLEKLLSFGLPVLPVYLHNVKELSLSVSLPAREKVDVIFSYGELIEPSNASVSRYLQDLYLASEKAFSSRSFLNLSLAQVVLEGLKNNLTSTLYDGTSDDSFTYGKILGASVVLSKELKKLTRKKRIGIILPPGRVGLIANIAALFAGKVPVNLNYTASEKSIKSAIKQAEIDRFITADPFVRKFPSFPWPPTRDLIHIERVLPPLKQKDRKVGFLDQVFIC